MREKIHPKYVESSVSCACGASFKTRSTIPVIKLEICSQCHPFFTGKQKLVDTAGRVERFQKRFSKTSGKTVRRKAKKAPKKAVLHDKKKKLTTSPRKLKKIDKKSHK